MYAAKEAGGARFRLIDDDLRVRSSERPALEADLRAAIYHDQLHLEYQPVVDITTGRITGVEALLRWAHPVRGNVPPIVFVPLAEEAGIIDMVGEFVLAQACRQTSEWIGAGHDLRVAINVPDFSYTTRVSSPPSPVRCVATVSPPRVCAWS